METERHQEKESRGRERERNSRLCMAPNWIVCGYIMKDAPPPGNIKGNILQGGGYISRIYGNRNH